MARHNYWVKRFSKGYMWLLSRFPVDGDLTLLFRRVECLRQLYEDLRSFCLRLFQRSVPLNRSCSICLCLVSEPRLHNDWGSPISRSTTMGLWREIARS